MSNHLFVVANPIFNREKLIELNAEYMAWVFSEIEKHFGSAPEGISGMTAREYVTSVIDTVCGDPPPAGIFYIVKVAGRLAGMGGLRCLGDDVAEIKRIYCRPEFRGAKLGELVLNRLLFDALAFGYRRVVLDTACFMTSAHRLYAAKGFSDCAAYEGTEVPPQFHSQWRFMERSL